MHVVTVFEVCEINICLVIKYLVAAKYNLIKNQCLTFYYWFINL